MTPKSEESIGQHKHNLDELLNKPNLQLQAPLLPQQHDKRKTTGGSQSAIVDKQFQEFNKFIILVTEVGKKLDVQYEEIQKFSDLMRDISHKLSTQYEQIQEAIKVQAHLPTSDVIAASQAKVIENWLKTGGYKDLQGFIEECFNIDELIEVCAQMNIRYERFGRDPSLPVLSRELILYCERRGMLELLMMTFMKERRKIFAEKIPSDIVQVMQVYEKGMIPEMTIKYPYLELSCLDHKSREIVIKAILCQMATEAGVQPDEVCSLGDKDGSLEIHLQMKRSVAEKLTQYIQSNDSIEIIQTDLTPENIQEFENLFSAQYFFEIAESQDQKENLTSQPYPNKATELESSFPQTTQLAPTPQIQTSNIAIDVNLLWAAWMALEEFVAMPTADSDKELLQKAQEVQTAWRGLVTHQSYPISKATFRNLAKQVATAIDPDISIPNTESSENKENVSGVTYKQTHLNNHNA